MRAACSSGHNKSQNIRLIVFLLAKGGERAIRRKYHVTVFRSYQLRFGSIRGSGVGGRWVGVRKPRAWNEGGKWAVLFT
jgi:hypothetical protein